VERPQKLNTDGLSMTSLSLTFGTPRKVSGFRFSPQPKPGKNFAIYSSEDDMTNTYSRIMLFVFLLGVVGCSGSPPISTASNVDLDRFMGDWYVIANIPTFIEKDAFNAVESYSLNEDGTVATTFRFRKGSITGEEKTYHPTGYILDNQSNAIWGMQFFWPFKADYRIVFVAEDYSQTIIGRNQRDYIWIMARTPQISEEDYQQLLTKASEQGYEISEIQKVPQQWREMT